MGLEDFSSDDNSSDDSTSSVEDDWDNEMLEGDDFPSYNQIGTIIRHHCLNKNVDIEVNNDELKGNSKEFGKLFALMFLKYPDADPYQLEDPR